MEKSINLNDSLYLSKNSKFRIFIFFFLLHLYSNVWGQNTTKKIDLSSYEEQLPYSQLTHKQSQTAKLLFQANLMKMEKSVAPRFISLVLPSRNRQTGSLIERGVLITYHSFKAKKVEVGGSFNNWNRISLKQNLHGVWFTILNVKPAQKVIHYKLCIDDSWILNPLGETHFLISSGDKVSVFHYKYIIFDKQAHAKLEKNGQVVFQIYSPDATRVSVAGDFNQWNVWHDFLRKGSDGIWRIKLFLRPGKFLYRYYIDDQWKLDLYNPQTRLDKTGILSSLIDVP